MKQKIQNIIVGVDFSKYSKLVVREAQELGKKMNIPVIYIYVFQDIAVYQDTFRLIIAKLTKNYERDVRIKYDLVATDKVFVKFGRPDEEIIKVAKKYLVPLILVGHRGTNPIVRFLLGSTAENLAIASPFPVWIHRGEKVLLPKRILLPCDLSEKSEHAIDEVEPLKNTLKASVELYHVFEEPMPILDAQAWANVYGQMMKIDDLKIKAFKKKHSNLKTVRSIGSVSGNIQKYSKPFDLIALTPREHKKNRLAFGSVTSKLIRSGIKPLLVLP